jgi:hypothetical protein
MSFKEQDFFSTTITNDTLVITGDMSVNIVSMVLISGVGTYLLEGKLGTLDSTAVDLVVGAPVNVVADPGYSIRQLTIDCSAGGVINIISK